MRDTCFDNSRSMVLEVTHASMMLYPRRDTGDVVCVVAAPWHCKLHGGISILTAELCATYMACAAVKDVPSSPLGVAVLSDSKSLSLQ